MQIDHIFIFTKNGTIADELVNFCFTEGSSRIHIGQGTTNRKFYFGTFFLEILWVHNPTKLKAMRFKIRVFCSDLILQKMGFQHLGFVWQIIQKPTLFLGEVIITNPVTFRQVWPLK